MCKCSLNFKQLFQVNVNLLTIIELSYLIATDITIHFHFTRNELLQLLSNDMVMNLLTHIILILSIQHNNDPSSPPPLLTSIRGRHVHVLELLAPP